MSELRLDFFSQEEKRKKKELGPPLSPVNEGEMEKNGNADYEFLRKNGFHHIKANY